MDKLLDPAILIFLVGGIIAVVAIIAHYLNDYGKARAEKEIKELMIEQGMSVEEIERVLLAGKALSTREAVQMAQKHADARKKT